jgi:glutamate racemase
VNSLNRIGVIDSGVGGLTVAREIMRQLPRESISYFGDTARCPYGPRPREEVREFTLQMVSYLLQLDIKALVIACNTATAVVLQEIMASCTLPVIGVIEPGARTAIKETKNGNVGVIGTVGTISSGAYSMALKRINPSVQIYSLACPELVPLVESGIPDKEQARHIVKRSLQPLINCPIDTLILGCTHYPLLSDLIEETMGQEVSLISSAGETARELSALLSHRGLLINGTHGVNPKPKHTFFVSGNASVCKAFASTWMEGSIDLKQVNL